MQYFSGQYFWEIFLDNIICRLDAIFCWCNIILSNFLEKFFGKKYMLYKYNIYYLADLIFFWAIFWDIFWHFDMLWSNIFMAHFWDIFLDTFICSDAIFWTVKEMKVSANAKSFQRSGLAESTFDLRKPHIFRFWWAVKYS